jgi:hypothetical protein
MIIICSELEDPTIPKKELSKKSANTTEERHALFSKLVRNAVKMVGSEKILIAVELDVSMIPSVSVIKIGTTDDDLDFVSPF